MNRREILDSSIKCVCGERDEQYGSPEDNFATIAELWTAYLRAVLKERIGALRPEDVGMMMALLKVARTASGRVHADNFVDGAGYFACAGEIATKEADDLSEVNRLTKELIRPVYCRECRHANDESQNPCDYLAPYYCYKLGEHKSAVDYCSRGERWEKQ